VRRGYDRFGARNGLMHCNTIGAKRKTANAAVSANFRSGR
jgi:hypothetical protein